MVHPPAIKNKRRSCVKINHCDQAAFMCAITYEIRRSNVVVKSSSHHQRWWIYNWILGGVEVFFLQKLFSYRSNAFYIFKGQTIISPQSARKINTIETFFIVPISIINVYVINVSMIGNGFSNVVYKLKSLILFFNLFIYLTLFDDGLCKWKIHLPSSDEFRFILYQ